MIGINYWGYRDYTLNHLINDERPWLWICSRPLNIEKVDPRT